MWLHDAQLYELLFGLRITNWQNQTVAPALPESILGHGPSMLQRCLDAPGHAGDQGLWRRVAPRNPQQLPAERREGVRLLSSLLVRLRAFFFEKKNSGDFRDPMQFRIYVHVLHGAS